MTQLDPAALILFFFVSVVVHTLMNILKHTVLGVHCVSSVGCVSACGDVTGRVGTGWVPLYQQWVHLLISGGRGVGELVCGEFMTCTDVLYASPPMTQANTM